MIQRAISARRRGVRHQGQQGFALLVVLFVILVCSLLVVALLGMSFATTGLSISQDEGDRRSRAADSALETAVNYVARDATGNLGYPPVEGYDDTDCSLNGEVQVGDVEDESATVVRPGVRVAITCEALTTESGNTSLIGVAKTDDTGAVSLDGVKVIGTEYNGDRRHSGSYDWADIFPWSDVMGTGAYSAAANSYNATMVHEGPAPLSVAADLQVTGGVAAARSDDVANLTPLDPALGVTGAFTQGQAGLFSGSPAYNPANPAASCGVYEVGEEFRKYGASVRSGGGSACTDALSKDVTWQTPGITSPPPAQWTSDTIAANLRTVSTACSPVMTMQAGAYNKVETAKLNQVFSSCTGSLVHFLPGDYWFDVDNGTGSGRSELKFNNAGVRVVFGTLKDGGSAAAFPEACKTPGVSITLSPRTSIRHEKGRVAICGTNGPSSLAVWQANSSNVGWLPTEPTINPGGIETGFTNSGDGLLNPNDGMTSTAQVPCSSTWFDQCTDFQTRTLTITDFLSTGDPGEASISSVQILVKGSQSRADDSGSGVRAEVFIKDSSAADPAGRFLCRSTLGGLPQNNDTFAYELLGSNGTCKALLTSRSQLANATIKLHFDLSPNCGAQIIGEPLCLGGPRVDLDYVAVRVPWVPRSETPAVYNPSFNNPQGWLRVDDGQQSEANAPCNFEFLSWCAGPDIKSFTLAERNFTDLYDPETSDPSATIESAGLVLKGRNYSVDAGDSSITVQVLFGSGGNCSFTAGGLVPHDNLPLYINLLQGSCASALTNPSQLVGGEVRVTTNLDRDGWCFWPFCPGGWGAIVDYMSISTTVTKPPVPPGTPDEEISANAYEGPRTPFLITSDNDAGSSSDAVFAVFGRVELPRADLDIHWNGPTPLIVSDSPKPGSLAVAPIFAGTGPQALVVNGLGSTTNTHPNGADMAGGDGQVGVLCCGPAKPAIRRVKLTAHLNSPAGRVLGVATALISDQSVDPMHPGLWAPGQRIQVESWTLCNNEDRSSSRKPECAGPG